MAAPLPVIGQPIFIEVVRADGCLWIVTGS
ncbi:hypothetical protein CHELA20_51415 [Hyphomicrobiales bacterium]|jgi:hypothetical protein|nr:hypothetical protein CHELA20_51415 [Hyphomicrobiales bacterium]